MKMLLADLKKILDKHQKKKAFLIMLAMIPGSLLEVMGVSAVVPLITVMLNGGSETVRNIYEFLNIRSDEEFVYLCIGFIMAVYIVKNFYLYIERKLQTGFAMNCSNKLRKILIGRYMRCGYEFYLSEDSNNVHHLLITDVENTVLIIRNVLMVLTEGLIALFIAITVFILDPIMTAWAVATLMITSLGILVILKPKMNKMGEEYIKTCVRRNGSILQGIRGIKEVKTLHADGFIVKNACEASDKTADIGRRNVVYKSLPSLIIETVCICSMLVYIGIALRVNGDVSMLIPKLGSFAMAAVKLLPATNRSIGAITEISYRKMSLHRVSEVLQKVFEEADGTCAMLQVKNEYEKEDSIVIRNVSYKYPTSSKYVLENINAEMPLNRLICVTGESGAGKTTFADLTMGLLKPTSGEIYVRKTKEKGSKEDNCKEKICKENYTIGYIPQFSFMLDDTIRANVAFGLEEEEIDDERIKKCLEQAGLDNFIGSLEKGILTRVGEQGIRMSGGQRERLGIARALYRDCDILIMDEPTAALDEKNEEVILENIKEMIGEKTVIMIAHGKKTIEACEIVYEIEDGRLTCVRR